MADEDFDHVPLDLDSSQARAAIDKALALATAARSAGMLGDATAWTNYELAINSAVRETLSDDLEQLVDRLAWTLHGLATVAGAAAYHAGAANKEDPVDVDQAIRRVIEDVRPSHGPAGD
jgi:hypothetical protein